METSPKHYGRFISFIVVSLVFTLILAGCGNKQTTQASYDPTAQIITTSSGFKVKLTKAGSGYTAAIVGATIQARKTAKQALSLTPEEASVLAETPRSNSAPVSYMPAGDQPRELAYDWSNTDIVIPVPSEVSVDTDNNSKTSDENIPVTEIAGNESDYRNGDAGNVALDMSDAATSTPSVSEITVDVPGAYVKDATNILWRQQEDGALALYSLPTTTTAANPKVTEGLGTSMPTTLFGQETTISAEFIKALADRYSKATSAATTDADCVAITQEIAALQKWLGTSANAKTVLDVLTKALQAVTAKQTALKTTATQTAQNNSGGSSRGGSGSSGSSGSGSSSGGGGRSGGPGASTTDTQRAKAESALNTLQSKSANCLRYINEDMPGTPAGWREGIRRCNDVISYYEANKSLWLPYPDLASHASQIYQVAVGNKQLLETHPGV